MDMDLMMNEMTGGDWIKVVRRGHPDYDPVNLEDNYYYECIECMKTKNYSAFGYSSCEVCKVCYNKQKNGYRDRQIKNALKKERRMEGNYKIVRLRGREGRKEKYLYKFKNGRWVCICKELNATD